VSFYVIKSTGKKELFSIKKFRRSLRKAGASQKLITEIVKALEKKPEMRSTKEIYEFALSFLHKKDRPIAARYNLKKALMDLGPAGYSFETFIAELFRAQGYIIDREKVVPGACIDHEVDVSAHKDKKHYMIECKFHNRRGLKSDVKVTLYIQARFDDIKKAWKKRNHHDHKIHGAWVVTNTSFTSLAIKYAECVGIQLLDWKYPEKTNLPDTIHKFGLHPITALTTLNKRQQKECIKAGFVLCRQARQHKELLKRFKFSDYQIKKLIQEAETVCTLTEKK